VLILASAEKLVNGTVGVAQAVRVSPFLVATLALGFDPENLAVGAVASFENADGLALGTILGSAMVAIALAFGITALVAPMRFERIPPEILAVPVAAVILLGALALDGRLSRVDGAILLAGYGAAITVLVRLARRGRDIRGAADSGTPQAPEPRRTLASVGILAASLLAIIIGGELLVTGATDLIRRFDLSQTVVGMTVIALAISAEELARELPAAIKGRPDIAFGNVAGSILAFFLFNAGAIAVIGPLELGPGTTRFYLPLAAGTGVLVCALALRGKFPRWTGFLLVLVYAVFVAGGYLLPG
jgi:cation:H+ antiporter